jgi:uncharacterized integral membrane protein
MQYVTGTVAVLLFLMVGIFSFQNWGAVDLSFLVWTTTVPKVFLILGTYLLGMVSGWGLVELLKRIF